MAELIIKPVSFTGNKVNKWQATAIFTEGNQNRAISGDPESTERKAVISLEDECKKWNDRIKQTKEEISVWLAAQTSLTDETIKKKNTTKKSTKK